MDYINDRELKPLGSEERRVWDEMRGWKKPTLHHKLRPPDLPRRPLAHPPSVSPGTDDGLVKISA